MADYKIAGYDYDVLVSSLDGSVSRLRYREGEKNLVSPMKQGTGAMFGGISSFYSPNDAPSNKGMRNADFSDLHRSFYCVHEFLDDSSFVLAREVSTTIREDGRIAFNQVLKKHAGDDDVIMAINPGFCFRFAFDGQHRVWMGHSKERIVDFTATKRLLQVGEDVVNICSGDAMMVLRLEKGFTPHSCLALYSDAPNSFIVCVMVTRPEMYGTSKGRYLGSDKFELRCSLLVM